MSKAPAAKAALANSGPFQPAPLVNPPLGEAPSSTPTSDATGLHAKLLPRRTCQIDYPGGATSKFRINALFRDKLTAALGKDAAGGAVGNFGQLVLSAGTGFPFDDLSSAISSDTRDRLRGLIGRYIDAVATVVGANQSIDYVVVGHASPSFDGVYLSPEECSGKGAQLNQSFAADRAKTVADALVSLRSGLSSHVEFKSIGHHFPLATEVGAKSKRCGEFDCEASKRVEIFFYATPAAAE